VPTNTLSDKLFLSIFEKTANSILVKADAGFTIVAVSDSYLELANTTRDQIVGQQFFEVLPKITEHFYVADAFRNSFEQVVKTRNTVYLQYPDHLNVFVHQSGQHYWSVTNKPVLDADGKVGYIIHNVVNITEQITQEVARQAHAHGDAMFRDLVMQAPIAISVLKGNDLIVETANAQMLEVWGKARQIIGKPLAIALPELEGQPFLQLLKDVLSSGSAHYGYETPATLVRNGVKGLFYFNFVYYPLEENGEYTGVIIVATEVTEQVEARLKLETAEERLRLATEATGFGTFDLDIIGNKIVYSPRLAEIFGYGDTKHLTHLDLQAHVHPEDVSTVQNAFQQALKNGGSYFYEVRNIWPDKSVHWFRTQGNLMFDKSSNPVRLVGAVVDVTSQRHIINELQRSEENLRMATEAAELGTFDWDIPADKLNWDARHRQLFGIPATEFVTLDWFLKTLYPDDHDRVNEALDYAFNKEQSGGDYDVDYRIIGFADKKLHWIRAKGKVVFDDQNNPLRLVGTVVDITDRKQDEIRKSDFVAMASHELKTPLTSLKAYIQMLLLSARKADNQFFSTSLEKANKQIDKMTKLIYSFLDLSKIESGKLQLNLEYFNITDAINEAIVDIRPISQSHQIIFEPERNVVVHADREKIMQVAVNLISNAVKYSPKGTPIVVSVQDNENWTEVAVKDEGIGIKAYDMQKIFQRFYRVQDEKTKGFSGFGIGLYLSAEIMTLHHGEIDVKSDEERGSTFCFRLPKNG
jgi:PAS domain S-box-containing protein